MGKTNKAKILYFVIIHLRRQGPTYVHTYICMYVCMEVTCQIDCAAASTRMSDLQTKRKQSRSQHVGIFEWCNTDISGNCQAMVKLVVLEYVTVVSITSMYLVVSAPFTSFGNLPKIQHDKKRGSRQDLRVLFMKRVFEKAEGRTDGRKVSIE